ncbi:transglycosylase family protein [Streptomyces sp. NPDC052023]|uniref:LysM peptidoglycan-binding domain-containing protein n=1 Tax=Streptomyces sp. NPDC052023 TaxID=3365681 RepID=UPI0037D36578
MLSGNGRHRRPRQAPALVVAAGVTGSAIAIPLLGATGASAAGGTTWDRVAECETGGSWSADTGNGYYGGLQLSQQDWEKYGGLMYAASADRASRSQQIAVAEKVLADQGVGAWATCGPLVGLDVDTESAAVDTGVAGDASSTPSHTRSSDSGSLSNSLGLSHSSGRSHADGSSGSGGSSDADESHGSGAPTDSAKPSSPANPTNSPDSTESGESGQSRPSDGSTSQEAGGSTSPDSSGSPSSSESPESGESPSSSPSSDVPSGMPSTSNLTDTGALGTGKHRGGSADEGDGRSGESAGRHASRGAAGTRAAVDGSYTVRDGDSLWSIADSLDVQGGWAALYAGNKNALGADPDHIVPGQELDIRAE